MHRSYRFWVLLAGFEIIFGVAIFAVTRQYYLGENAMPAVDPVASSGISARPDNITEADLAQFDLLIPAQSDSNDPTEISRQANEFFALGQYELAAVLYEKLLAFGPGNADAYNNLGITLHYLGRSTEALQRLREGIAADPTHQRIWLTTGFVNSQLGNIDEARTALANAVEIGTDEQIRRSATEMLEQLP